VYSPYSFSVIFAPSGLKSIFVHDIHTRLEHYQPGSQFIHDSCSPFASFNFHLLIGLMCRQEYCREYATILTNLDLTAREDSHDFVSQFGLFRFPPQILHLLFRTSACLVTDRESVQDYGRGRVPRSGARTAVQVPARQDHPGLQAARRDIPRPPILSIAHLRHPLHRLCDTLSGIFPVTDIRLVHTIPIMKPHVGTLSLCTVCGSLWIQRLITLANHTNLTK
jgi:hypothetical protein